MKPCRLLAILALAGCAPGSAPEPPRAGPGVFTPSPQMIESATAAFHQVRDTFVPWFFQSHPVRATELGVHDHDSQLPELDRNAFQRRIEEVLRWLADLETIDGAFLQDDDRFDYALLELALRAELMELEETRQWTRNPRLYPALIARGIVGVAEREYAPLVERSEALRGRMAAAPAVLEAARENLGNPPRLWTQLAVEDTRALIRFLESELPAILRNQAGTGPAPSLDGPTATLVEALESYARWLEEELLPRSNGTVRLGRYLFERKLLQEEHVALGLPELERLNETAIDALQERLEEAMAVEGAGQGAGAAVDAASSAPPPPDSLRGLARDLVVAMRERVAESGAVPLLGGPLPVVREMPTYAREGVASLDAPGPFESMELEVFLNLRTTRDEDLPSPDEQPVLQLPDLVAIVAGETYPGRYVQRTYEARVPSPIRRIFTARTFTDGWAHYAEQLALDGAAGVPEAELRDARLRSQLRRHAQWYAALEIHAKETPLDEVVQRYMEIAHLPERAARREVERVTIDPMALSYALGRMQLLELRDDYQAYLEEEGETFDPSAFHERVLSLALPPPLVREALIPIPSPTEPRRTRR